MTQGPGLIGECEGIQVLRQQIDRVAKSDVHVVVQGETGTGKELVAELLHAGSPRFDRELGVINCAALTETIFESEWFGHEKGSFTGAVSLRQGHFERADGGTLFLDEVGELSMACQAKLLRIVEGQSFQRVGGAQTLNPDVRIIAATNRDLRAMVVNGSFREDLFYRLCVIELSTPPLRERGKDIELLARRFLSRYSDCLSEPLRFSPRALAAIGRCRWPGNVRELKNAIQRATVLRRGPIIDVDDLGLNEAIERDCHSPLLQPLEAIQRQHVRRVLGALKGNKSAACKVLGISRATLYNKLTDATSHV